MTCVRAHRPYRLVSVVAMRRAYVPKVVGSIPASGTYFTHVALFVEFELRQNNMRPPGIEPGTFCTTCKHIATEPGGRSESHVTLYTI